MTDTKHYEKCAGCKECLESAATTGEQCVKMRDCTCHTIPITDTKDTTWEERWDAKIADGTDIVVNVDCACGFGESRGDQCDCPFEVHNKGYMAKKWIKDFIRTEKKRDMERLDTLLEAMAVEVEESAPDMSGFINRWGGT